MVYMPTGKKENVVPTVKQVKKSIANVDLNVKHNFQIREFDKSLQNNAEYLCLCGLKFNKRNEKSKQMK